MDSVIWVSVISVVGTIIVTLLTQKWTKRARDLEYRGTIERVAAEQTDRLFKERGLQVKELKDELSYAREALDRSSEALQQSLAERIKEIGLLDEIRRERDKAKVDLDKQTRTMEHMLHENRNILDENRRLVEENRDCARIVENLRGELMQRQQEVEDLRAEVRDLRQELKQYKDGGGDMNGTR